MCDACDAWDAWDAWGRPSRHQLYCFRDSRPHRLSLIGDSAHANERAGKLAGAQLVQRKQDMLQARACVRRNACVRASACVRACAHARVRACVRACARACCSGREGVGWGWGCGISR